MHHSVIAVAIACSVASTGSWSATTGWIVGLEKAKYYKGSASEYFIQAGAFSVKNNAIQYQKYLQSRTKTPVNIRSKGNLYLVVIGPLHSAAEVRTIAQAFNVGSSMRVVKSAPPVKYISPAKPIVKEKIVRTVDKDGFLIPSAMGGFFVGMQGGGAWPNNKTMFVDNGSDAEPPFNLDTYTVDNAAQGFLGATAGYRWQRGESWFPVASLSVRYNHLFSENIGGDVLLFSDPQFRDYAYNLTLSSDTVMAVGKLNVARYNKLLPYVSGGVGAAWNRLRDYSESPLPGVDPARISPAYANNTNNSEFTWSLGAGLDYQITPLMTLSLGYEFQNYGRFNTGFGLETWSSEQLVQNPFKTNSLLLSMDYLFAD